MTKDTNKTRFTCRMSNGLYSKIKNESDSYGISIAAMLNIIVTKYFENTKGFKNGNLN